MWTLVPGPGVDEPAVYVGEAMGCWMWAVLWPGTAGFLLIDDFVLTDLRDAGPRAGRAVRSAVPASAGLTGSRATARP